MLDEVEQRVCSRQDHIPVRSEIRLCREQRARVAAFPPAERYVMPCRIGAGGGYIGLLSNVPVTVEQRRRLQKCNRAAAALACTQIFAPCGHPPHASRRRSPPREINKNGDQTAAVHTCPTSLSRPFEAAAKPVRTDTNINCDHDR